MYPRGGWGGGGSPPPPHNAFFGVLSVDLEICRYMMMMIHSISSASFICNKFYIQRCLAPQIVIINFTFAGKGMFKAWFKYFKVIYPAKGDGCTVTIRLQACTWNTETQSPMCASLDAVGVLEWGSRVNPAVPTPKGFLKNFTHQNFWNITNLALK